MKVYYEKVNKMEKLKETIKYKEGEDIVEEVCESLSRINTKVIEEMFKEAGGKNVKIDSLITEISNNINEAF